MITRVQQGDVRIFQSQTHDGGDINVVGGLVEMNGGLESAAYLSLFGGNEDDTGFAGAPLTWWGNLIEDRPERKYRSKTQHLLQALPLTTENLVRLEDAALSDLDWFLSGNIASSVEVEARLVGLNRISFLVSIRAEGLENTFEFTENWKLDLALADGPVDVLPVSTAQGFVLLESGDSVLLEDGGFVKLES